MDDEWWIQHIFGLPLAAECSTETWQLVHAIAPVDAVSLVTRIFSNCGAVLASFSDQQVKEGLEFIGSSGESEWMYYVYDRGVPWNLRAACIRSIATIYRGCFARRCRNALKHLTSDTGSLNSTCYMWWDCFPTGGLPGTTNQERAQVDEEIIGVMAETLEIDHDACRESSLHGLGHWRPSSPRRVRAIVDDWVERHPGIQPGLLEYALSAREGHVQ